MSECMRFLYGLAFRFSLFAFQFSQKGVCAFFYGLAFQVSGFNNRYTRIPRTQSTVIYREAETKILKFNFMVSGQIFGFTLKQIYGFSFHETRDLKFETLKMKSAYTLFNQYSQVYVK
jgi:hypothetical protein